MTVSPDASENIGNSYSTAYATWGEILHNPQEISSSVIRKGLPCLPLLTDDKSGVSFIQIL